MLIAGGVAMKEHKCPNCGASCNIKRGIVVDKCDYCGSVFGERENVVTSTPTTKSWAPKRPEFNPILCLFLMMFSFMIGGLIYFFVIHAKQKEWDETYGNIK